MIDYVKFALPLSKYEQQFFDNPVYDFKGKLIKNTQEAVKPYKGYYKSLEVEINYQNVIVSGSLHKFYNLVMYGDYQNFDDFTYDRQCNALSIISNELDFDLRDAEIQNLEFGVNINTTFKPSYFLGNNLINMKMKEAMKEEFDNMKGLYRQFKFSNQLFKIYDKGGQNELEENILRLEVKAMRSEVVKPKDWDKDRKVLLTDLLSFGYLHHLRGILIERSKHLIMCDPFHESKNINAKDQKKLLCFTNPTYWTGLNLLAKDKMRMTGKDDRTAYKKRNQFRALMQKYNLNKMRTEIIKAVVIKSKELISKTQLKGYTFECNV